MRKRSEATRLRIVLVATELFLSQGYVATTVDAIAERATTTKRTVYGYFPDKRSIFKGVVEHAMGDPWEFEIPLEAIVTQEGLHNALYTLAAGVNDVVTRPEYVQLLRVAISEVATQSDLQVLFERGVIRRSLRTLTALLTTANVHGIIASYDNNILARQFVGGFITPVLLDGLLHADPRPIEKLTSAELAEYVEIFMLRLGSSNLKQKDSP